MKTFYFDIETIPSQLPGIRDEFIAAVTAPGQYKKPESIAEWLKDNREAEGEAAWLKTSFDGGLGHVVAIGWAVEDEEPRCYYESGDVVADERSLIEDFFTTLGEAGRVQLVGHNIIGFDLPFLWKRAMVLGIKPPSNFPRNPKPWGDEVADTMLLWDGQQRAGGSMDRICRLMGIPGKGDMDGSKVWPAVRDGRIAEVAEYCRQDVARTRAMHRRMIFA
jgi:predicted PolB exonuclease-like 3'-5' exonuclease